MNEVFKLSRQQYAELERHIKEVVVSDDISEKELYYTIGRCLYFTSDIDLSSKSSEPNSNKKGKETDNLATAIMSSFWPENPSPIDIVAFESGKNFWERLMDQLAYEFYAQGNKRYYFSGSSEFRDHLEAIIPIFLSSRCITTFNSSVMTALVASLALMVKAGQKKYCEA